jgi:O-methyltransferase involved in polyketide biosynthesis
MVVNVIDETSAILTTRDAGVDRRRTGRSASFTLFGRRHAPKATRAGLALEAGLDTRVSGISPPTTIDWYDIDFPEVITAW